MNLWDLISQFIEHGHPKMALMALTLVALTLVALRWMAVKSTLIVLILSS